MKLKMDPTPLAEDLHKLLNSGDLVRALEYPQAWKSLRIDDEYPHVDRLYADYNGVVARRVMLHAIHPLPEGQAPLYHAHSAPSIVYVTDFREGSTYAMRAGTAEKVLVGTSTRGPLCYTMLDPDGYHSVEVHGAKSFSIMLAGEPWPNHHARKPARPLEPLSPRVAKEYLETWRILAQEFAGA